MHPSKISRILTPLTAALLALTVLAIPTPALASTDTSGSTFVADGGTVPSGIEGDLYWAGQSLGLTDTSIDRDVIAAGETVGIDDVTVGGAVRAAGRSIDIAHSTIGGSVTVAGQDVVFNAESKAAGVYAAGQTVKLLGSTQAAALAGETVTIDGEVKGDVEVWADKLILGDNARITGTVTAHVSQDPERASGAQVGALKIDRTKAEAAQSTVTDTIGEYVFAAVSTCLVALLLEVVFPRAVHGAADMVKTHPGALWLTGVIACFALIPALLILFLTIAGITVAGALLCAVIAAALVSNAFAGANIARAFAPKANRFAIAAAGGAVAGVLAMLPILGNFVSGLCFIQMVGYLVQTVIQNARTAKPASQAPAQLPQA